MSKGTRLWACVCVWGCQYWLGCSVCVCVWEWISIRADNINSKCRRDWVRRRMNKNITMGKVSIITWIQLRAFLSRWLNKLPAAPLCCAVLMSVSQSQEEIMLMASGPSITFTVCPHLLSSGPRLCVTDMSDSRSQTHSLPDTSVLTHITCWHDTGITYSNCMNELPWSL